MEYKERIVRDLEIEMNLLEIESKEKKQKKLLKQFLITFIPSIIAMIVGIVTDIKILYVSGAVYLAVGTIIKMISDDVKKEKNIKEQITNPPEKIEKEPYTEKYLSKAKKLDIETSERKISIVEDKHLVSTILIELIRKELDIYYSMYELPPFELTDDELSKIIEVIEHDFRTDIIYEKIMYLLRMVYVKSLKEKYVSIGLEEILNNLYYIYYGEKGPKEIKRITESIRTNINKVQNEELTLSKNIKSK